ncbi:leiomodin-1 [Trichomycterus rosablanca]|uniref:leiomodin-1 n=1 Tax=Trichomycterus rosablanca TaxID=2290929 RepID=UPI002F35F0EC
MSRRKVRGLTRTGRQVSEDPDLDNLLSNLSPEEMEELQKEVSTVPDPDPNEMMVVDSTDFKQSAPMQRKLSTEGEPRRESRKQEYLRKMGLSQEKNISRTPSMDGNLQRQSSITTPSAPTPHENHTQGRNTRTTEDCKGVRASRIQMDEESENKRPLKEKERDECKTRDRLETKESNSKTKELIAKLQDKKEYSKDKDKKEECRKKEPGESKTKDMISRLQGKQEKEERKEREMKPKGLVSKLEENLNQVSESKAVEGRKADEKEKINKPELDNDKEKGSVQTGVKKDNNSADRTSENERNNKDLNEGLHINSVEGRDSFTKEREETKQNKILNETLKSSEDVSVGKNAEEKNSKSKTKEEEVEDESTSMFAEDLQRVCSNDPKMTELNVNNSEVIKIKTLIQFAEALCNNTHIKTFALANCRADDHVAYAIAGTLRKNKTITSINLDSNLLTSKGIMALVQALQYNSTLTELRFHNQRHICGGKTEMEMTKILKENTTLLKLGYHFELAGPRMTMTNILSRNMDRQRQKRLQEQKQAQIQGNGDKQDLLAVPGSGLNKCSPRNSPKPSPNPSPVPSPKLIPKTPKGPSGIPPPPPPPGGLPPPPPPILDPDFLKNSLTPASKRKLEDKTGGRGGSVNSRDQLLASIRDANIKQLKKVSVPKLLQ